MNTTQTDIPTVRMRVLKLVQNRLHTIDSRRESRWVLRVFVWGLLILAGVALPTGMAVEYQVLASYIRQASPLYRRIEVVRTQILFLRARPDIDNVLAESRDRHRLHTLIDQYREIARQYAQNRHSSLGRPVGWLFHAPRQLPEVHELP